MFTFSAENLPYLRHLKFVVYSSISTATEPTPWPNPELTGKKPTPWGAVGEVIRELIVS